MFNANTFIKNSFEDLVEVLEIILNDNHIPVQLETISKLIRNTFLAGNKILLCGNGGSASDADHIAAEFLVKFKNLRQSLPAISLNSNNSVMTAVGNDFSFEEIFSRQVEGFGKEGDILWAFSTSGESRNIIRALRQAKEQNLYTILFTKSHYVYLHDSIIDYRIEVPSMFTPRIQEVHTLLGHIVCDLVERGIG